MYGFISGIISLLKRMLPEPLIRALKKPYHLGITFLFALLNRFPAYTMTVIGITGTKGKSTVSEMMFAILRASGKHTALASTIRFATDEDSAPNRFKMTMQGRGYLQEFLGKAKRRGATHAVVEITSEGARQYRNAFLFLDALIVTNIAREHIESHGSFEAYVAAKRSIVTSLERSPKKNRILVANTDNEYTNAFLSACVTQGIAFSESELTNLSLTDDAVHFSYKNTQFSLPLPGAFNALNALAAIKVAEALAIPLTTCAEALKNMHEVKGRLQSIQCGQPFRVIVDYAHTPDSLQALYDAFPNQHKICVLGNTGGGRDTWKRPLMGAIADAACSSVILTNEDPYNEDPEKILADMTPDMQRTPRIILDRREAIREALREAKEGDVVLISGKGTDPFIMEAHGTKREWSDEAVTKEELRTLGFSL